MNEYDVLEDSLQALERGQDLDSILARHPDLAQELRPILEASLLARTSDRAPIPSDVQRRGRTRLLQHAAELREARSSKRHTLIPFFPRLAITLGIVGVLVLSSTGLVNASGNALPGDQLYPVKRTWEDVRLLFVFNSQGRELLQSQYEQERLDEIDELLMKGRPASITFSGLVRKQQDGRWLVSGVPVEVTASTRLPAEGIPDGAPVMVTGMTRSDGVVEAQEIQTLQAGVPLPPLEPSDHNENHNNEDQGKSEDIQALPAMTTVPARGIPAPDPRQHEGENKSYEFTGVVVSMQGNAWKINGQTVSVEQAQIIGNVQVGSVVKFEGFYDSNGRFVVTMIEVNPGGDGGSSDGGHRGGGDGDGSGGSGGGGSGGEDGDKHGGGDETPHP
jgi:hypothetical protein